MGTMENKMHHMDKLEAKIRIFEAIANNSEKLCDSNRYMTPKWVAKYTNEVYDILANTEDEK